MQKKNTVYTATPPDIALNTNGPYILLMGVKRDDSEPYVSMLDRIFPLVEVTLYVSDEGFTDDNAGWFRATAGMASHIFIDVDNASEEEIFLAMQAIVSNTAYVIWVSINSEPESLLSLLNSYGYRIYDDFIDIEAFLADEHNKIH